MFQVSLRWSECHLAAESVWAATTMVHSASVRPSCQVGSGGCRDVISVFREMDGNV